jgi:Cu2+-exporting ATPase
LAFPLTDEMATTALRRFGVFVREADLWPRLAGVRRMVFDKTGTLTLETPRLLNPDALGLLAPTARAALAALVRDNAHPVAQCLHQALCTDGDTRAPSGGTVGETPGYGVEMTDADGRWSLGRPGWANTVKRECHLMDDTPDSAHDTEFCCDGVMLARFRFADAVRPDAAAEVAAFRAAGKDVFILSGDRQGKVDAMARELGLPPAHAVGEATPAQKAAWLRQHDRRDTMMLGDGANDSLAFDAAFVRGTPVAHRGVLEGKADFYYLGHGLAGLRRLFEVNETRRRTQAALLVFSVAYNLLAVGLAAFGHMSPLLAAILMPVSSLLTLAIVGARMRRWLRI